MIEVAIIDYGVGNLLSVSRAMVHCGAKVQVTADPAVILAADRVILPGVGAFANGMAALRTSGLVAVVHQVAAAGTPLLGICLGMQMLMASSEEFGDTDGLGLIPGRVVQIPGHTSTGEPHKIPHIGWNALVPASAHTRWQGGLLDGITPGEAVYFVHSFMAQPTDPADRLADCVYGGLSVSASVQRGLVMGCQFHPEKSGEVGLRVLTNFLRQPCA
ncbi:MAG: Imidazole glycerol phosphate synthase subunit HisH 1 [Pseudomonadota bacterium]|jgi:glutamine amidotransferase